MTWRVNFVRSKDAYKQLAPMEQLKKLKIKNDSNTPYVRLTQSRSVFLQSSLSVNLQHTKR